jgi:molybdopterin molybdotransferase
VNDPIRPASDRTFSTRRAHGGLPWRRARVLAHTVATPLAPKLVLLQDATGLTLAEDLCSRGPLPAFDTAAMDGYAVCDPRPYRLRWQITAGSTWSGFLRPGEAVQILDRRPGPRGSDRCPAPRRRNRRRGRRTWSPPHVGKTHSPRRRGRHDRTATSACGIRCRSGHARIGRGVRPRQPLVTPRPRVQIVVTGDELTHSGVSSLGLVRDSLGLMLPALVCRDRRRGHRELPHARRPARRRGAAARQR